MDAKVAALVKKKEKKLMETRDVIYNLNDTISQKAKELKALKSSEKSERVAASRLSSHKTQLRIDRANRPSDRDYEIRQYTIIDGDVWKYDDLRQWFNKGARDVPKETKALWETGYTIRVDDAV
jgi:hypothetical protein